jgi:hypothetical protein
MVTTATAHGKIQAQKLLHQTTACASAAMCCSSTSRDILWQSSLAAQHPWRRPECLEAGFFSRSFAVSVSGLETSHTQLLSDCLCSKENKRKTVENNGKLSHVVRWSHRACYKDVHSLIMARGNFRLTRAGYYCLEHMHWKQEVKCIKNNINNEYKQLPIVPFSYLCQQYKLQILTFKCSQFI